MKIDWDRALEVGLVTAFVIATVFAILFAIVGGITGNTNMIVASGILIVHSAVYDYFGRRL